MRTEIETSTLVSRLKVFVDFTPYFQLLFLFTTGRTPQRGTVSRRCPQVFPSSTDPWLYRDMELEAPTLTIS